MEVPNPQPGEVVVLEEQLECGLRLPCSKFLESVLQKFQLEVQHISPNSFVRLSTFEWAFRSAATPPLTRAFVLLHAASVLTKS